MSVKVSGFTTSTTGTHLIHGPSNAAIRTEAPVDNGGDGSSFSPTDLCTASLGACGLTIMKMFAEKKGIPVEKIAFEAIKEMSAAPRKIAKITIVYKIFSMCSEEDFAKIVAAGKSCPVRVTLGDSVMIDERYERALES